MPTSTFSLRPLLMLVAVAALLAGMWAGLIRIGWALPPLQPILPMLHGPLMVSGFLGTLIGLERAVGTGKRWAYAGPALTATGAALALLGVPAPLPPLVITLGSAVTCAVLVTLVHLQPALFTAVIAAGGFAWLAGNLLWLLGQPIPVAVLWWVAFLVLTIAGERLELSRLLRLSQPVQMLFLASLAPLVLGAAVGPWQYEVAMRLASLLLRVAGDLFGWWEIRRWGGMLNVLVLLLFVLNTGLAVRQGHRMAADQTVRR